MSVEEQLERIRRHQQAALREKKRDTPSRSPSFSKDNPFNTLLGRPREEDASADPRELEAALQELELVRDQASDELRELDRAGAQAVHDGSPRAETPEETTSDQAVDEVDGPGPAEVEPQNQCSDGDSEVFETQRVVILEPSVSPQHVTIVNLQDGREEDLNNSPKSTFPNSCPAPVCEALTPEEEEEEEEDDGKSLSVPEQSEQTDTQENNIHSYQHPADDTKHNNNNNKMVAVKGLPSPPPSPSSSSPPSPPSPAQLTDGSHFMCV